MPNVLCIANIHKINDTANILVFIFSQLTLCGGANALIYNIYFAITVIK